MDRVVLLSSSVQRNDSLKPFQAVSGWNRELREADATLVTAMRANVAELADALDLGASEDT